MDKHNLNILIWNVCGLNARCRCDNLRLVVNNHNFSVLCVQETKLFVISAFYLNAMLSNRFSSYYYLLAIDTCGSVLIACRSPEVRCRSFCRDPSPCL
jgi:exonuclease III